MARIPVNVGSQRRLETGGVVQVPSGQPIGAAVEQAGGQVANRGLQIIDRKAQQDEQLDNFKFRAAQQQFDADLQRDLDAAQTKMPADATGFHDSFIGQVDPSTGAAIKPGLFDERAKQIRESLPESVRDKWDIITPVYRAEYSNRAAKVELTARQGYYRLELGKMLTNLENTVGQIDPNDQAAFATFRRQGEDAIDATGLPSLEKEELRGKWRQDSAEAVWKAFAVKDPAAAKAALGIGGASTSDNVVDKIISAESGGDTNAKNPLSSATGPAQFTSSTWMRVIRTYAPNLAAGLSRAETLALRADAKISRTMTEFLAKENTAKLQAAGVPVNDGSVYLAHFAGADGATSILRAVQTGKGHQSAAAILGEKATAANPFLQSMTAAELVALADKKMGGSGTAEVADKADPRFTDIPLNRRLALVTDADQAMNAARTDQAAAAKQQYDTALNTLKVGVMDGNAGLVDIQEARQAGWLTDAEDIRSLENLYETRNKDSLAEASVLSRITAGNATFDPSESSDDRKAIDRLYERAVPSQALAQGDQQAATGLFGLWRSTGVMAKKAKGDIAGMLRSPNVATNTTALSYLDALEHDRPDAFAREFDETTEKALSIYRSSLDYYSPQEIAERIKQSSDPQHRKAVEALKKEIQPDVDKMTFDDAVANMDTSWFSDPGSPVQNEQRAVFLNDYKALLLEHYGETGDLERAQREATGRLQRVWGVSPVNGNRLMKLPPEYFYPAIDQSHDWMSEQVSQALDDLGLFTEVHVRGQTVRTHAPYALVADGVTESERASGKLPSYQVWTFDEDGLPSRAAGNRRLVFDPAKANAERQPDRDRRRRELLAPDDRPKSALEQGIPY